MKLCGPPPGHLKDTVEPVSVILPFKVNYLNTLMLLPVPLFGWVVNEQRPARLEASINLFLRSYVA